MNCAKLQSLYVVQRLARSWTYFWWWEHVYFLYLSIFFLLVTQVLDHRTNFGDVRNSKVTKLLQDLSDECDSLPPSLYISDVIMGTTVIWGGEAHIWKGTYNGMDVAIRQFRQRQGMPSADWKKVVRLNPSLLQEMMLNSSFTQQIIRREIIIHRHLHHENILPLIGVFGDESHPFNIVMPWMHNGVAREYLKTRPDRFFDIVSVYFVETWLF
jgi:serine/threonine protein kinase